MLSGTKLVTLLTLPILILYGCNEDREIPLPVQPLFIAISETHSNINFINKIQESDTLNYYNFPYIYMGAGVGVGDFNNDGLSDLYVTGNMVENKLYLNKGNMVFEDVSVRAGVQGDDRWYTGVALVDINHDGYLDIYLSVSGKTEDTRNQLYINNGDLSFDEKSSEFGIDDASTSIQSTFFDYDKDGDLDLFVANYPLVKLTQGNRFYAYMMKQNKPKLSGHMYRNEGNNTFKDVTSESGLQNFGLTLGLIAADFNDDGWPDLYLSNDFNVPDYFYLNNGDGTFKEVLKQAIMHTSMFGMGIDAADFNNDGLIDIVQADMTPEDYTRSKVNMARMSPKSFWEAVDLGFHYQYMQNSLQVNNGIRKDGIPLMSEISQLAGIATTDWSWSILFMDMDNDGLKDLYITNGMKRDVNDNDLNQRTGATTFQDALKSVDIKKYPSEPINNYAYKNNGDFTFEKTTTKWGLNYKGFSNGMAYADLDNDGDLDLIINNLDQKISLYQNKVDETNNHHYLRVKLQGPEKNPLGLGSKLILKNIKTNRIQTFDYTLTRGFQSSMEPIVHFGLGDNIDAQLLTIIWPDGKEDIKTISTFNNLIEVNYTNASSIIDHSIPKEDNRQFLNVTSLLEVNFRHQEDVYDDYRYEPLLPNKYSTLGPGIAVADINNDGRDDFFVGNAKNAIGKLYLQTSTGNFKEMKGPWIKDKEFEDTGALFFDIDNDGDQDLYVVSGGYHKDLSGNSYQDRLYINTNGVFYKSDALPMMYTSGQVVAACDFDKDGDEDLFVGGRILPGKYLQSPQSHLLRNNGKKDFDLKFENITSKVAKNLSEIGMVTSAIWIDIDGDGWKDLIIAGEWMSIKLFKNNQGKMVEQAQDWNLNKNVGWWYSLEALDVDNDGDLDLIAGNLGLNYKYNASLEKPFEVFLNDFDKNGNQDIVFGVHKEGRLLPLRGRECSSVQIPAIKAKYNTYREFAVAELSDIYGKSMLENAMHHQATTFAHYWLENNGKGKFIWHLLPNRAQFSPINNILLFDFDGDDYKDLLVVGALYEAEVETSRADAGVGLVLRNKKGKGFEAVMPQLSKLYVTGNVKDAEQITFNGNQGFVFARNNDSLEFILYPGNRLKDLNKRD